MSLWHHITLCLFKNHLIDNFFDAILIPKSRQKDWHHFQPDWPPGTLRVNYQWLCLEFWCAEFIFFHFFTLLISEQIFLLLKAQYIILLFKCNYQISSKQNIPVICFPSKENFKEKYQISSCLFWSKTGLDHFQV